MTIPSPEYHEFEEYQNKIKTIILGDSANDVAMLEVADISIIVKSPSNHPLQKVVTPDFQTSQEASDGWAEGINAALAKLEESTYEELL